MRSLNHSLENSSEVLGSRTNVNMEMVWSRFLRLLDLYSFEEEGPLLCIIDSGCWNVACWCYFTLAIRESAGNI